MKAPSYFIQSDPAYFKKNKRTDNMFKNLKLHKSKSHKSKSHKSKSRKSHKSHKNSKVYQKI